jgi:hypothetical protein
MADFIEDHIETNLLPSGLSRRDRTTVTRERKRDVSVHETNGGVVQLFLGEFRNQPLGPEARGEFLDMSPADARHLAQVLIDAADRSEARAGCVAA